MNKEGKSLLNIRCANWRDYHHTWAETKQKDYYANCMAQDCVQSLEGGNSNKPNEPGCRFLDGTSKGFCYAYGTAQLWCAENTKSKYCKDGGEKWGMGKLGTATSPETTEWTPHQGVPVYDGKTPKSGAVYSCQCMKNCACTNAKKCYCVDKNQKPWPSTPGLNEFDPKMKVSRSSSKKGQCACVCGGVIGP